MKKIQLLPNVITAFGLTCGLFVIFRTNMIEPGCTSYESLQIATIVLILAGFFDVLDGAIARMTNGVSEFGGLFDSLSDAISFGVAPSVLMLKALALEPGTELSMLATSGAMVFSVCGVLRLVRFSVTQMPKSEEIADSVTGKSNFIGLPIPAAAGAATAMNLFLACDGVRSFIAHNPRLHCYILTGVMYFLGYLMVSRWRFPALKSFQIRVPSFQMVSAVVIAAVLIFFGLMHHFALVLVILSWGYILVALALAILHVFGPKKWRQMKELEPIDDE